MDWMKWFSVLGISLMLLTSVDGEACKCSEEDTLRRFKICGRHISGRGICWADAIYDCRGHEIGEKAQLKRNCAADLMECKYPGASGLNYKEDAEAICVQLGPDPYINKKN